MRSLPRIAQGYLIALWSLAASLLVWALFRFPPVDQLLLLVIGLVVYVLCDYFEVIFGVDDGGGVGMTVADAPLLFLVVVVGPPGALIVALGTAISDMLYRRAWFRSLFNCASKVIEFFTMLLTFTALHDPNTPPFSGLRGLLTFVAVAAISYLTNALLVGAIVALASRQSLLHIYREGYQSIRWVHFITLPLGAMAATLWFVDRWLLVLAIIPLVMAQRAFTAVAGWQTESRRNKALAEEQVRLNDELRQQQQELIRASKLAALGTFAAGIAHEFNNILAAILGHAQLGLTSSDVAEKDHSLDVAARVCQRGRSITTSLLTFARRREPQWGLHQVQDAVEDTLALVEHELAKDNIRVVRAFRPVPPTLCDPGQIGQVVLNLITNARDALQERGGGSITVSLAQQDAQILLSITDTGPGIPADLLDQIFQPFVTTKAPGKGTGLGMAICYGIVESHGGSIVVTSTVGQGTTVTIRLPINTAPVKASKVAESTPTLRLLLVDDEAEVAGALARLLEGRGHQVQVASNGEDALRRYKPRSVDVVLSDAIMPGMSGTAFVRQLKTLDPDVPVLVMTGHPDAPQVEHMLAAGAANVIGKPFLVEDVLTMIAGVLAPPHASHTLPNKNSEAVNSATV